MMRRKWTNWNKCVVLCHRLRLRFYVCMYITFNLNGLMVSFRWNENRSLCLCLVHTWAFSQTPCQPSGIRDGIQPYAWMNWIKPNEWPCLGEEKLGKTAVLVIRKIRNYCCQSRNILSNWIEWQCMRLRVRKMRVFFHVGIRTNRVMGQNSNVEVSKSRLGSSNG